MTLIRPATPDVIAAIVALNAAVVDLTSPMDAARCAALMDVSTWCLVAESGGQVVGFILSMAEGAPYENGNFAWFSARLRRFVYVDRVVVGAAGRGQGLGQQFYAEIAARASAQGCLSMVAEINAEPPNAPSLAFHQKQGFATIGERHLDKGVTVAMQMRSLGGGD